MNSALEFHDSKVSSIRVSGDGVVIMMEGYIHKSVGEPGVDPGTGWIQALRIELTGVSNASACAEAFTLADGQIVTENGNHDPIAVPFSHSGSVRIFLDSGTTIFEASGTEITIEAVGPARYVEEFPGYPG